jgi:CelD/BcsL family acetyltransferase involved in cellulose biosynthesis
MDAAVHGRWTVDESDGRDALPALEKDWRRLYRSTEQRSAFQTFEAFAAYLDHLAEAPDQIRLLALRDRGEVRGICLLESRTDSALGVPIRVWGTPFGPHWPISDVICPEDDARRAMLPAVVRHIRARPEGRQLLVVGPLPRRSVLWEGLTEVGGAVGHIAATPFVFDCERPFPDLMDRLSRHFRKQLRNYGNRLAKLSDVRFESTTVETPSAPAFDAFLEVEASGWKGEAGTGSAVRLDPERLAFYRSLATRFEDGEGCEINTLSAEGRCIAAEFCMRTGRQYACLKIGYDEDFARVSPGHLLHVRTLERCCGDSGISRYDQLSDAAWLASWRPDAVPLGQAFVPLRAWSRPALTWLLRLRFGCGRRVARRLRASLPEGRGAGLSAGVRPGWRRRNRGSRVGGPGDALGPDPRGGGQ